MPEISANNKLDFLKLPDADAGMTLALTGFIDTTGNPFLEDMPMTVCNLLIKRRTFLAGLACLGVACFAPASSFAQQPTNAAQRKSTTKPIAKKPAKPTLDFRTIVPESLARNPYYSPGFLISRVDVETLISLLLEKGIVPDFDQEDLYDSLLSDQSPLVNRLKTPKGRAFMKKVGSDPTAYDRLERLSWSVDGRKLLDSMLSSKDSYERFQKLKMPADLAKVSKALAADPRTQDFSLPTGHIHTADQLVKRLEELCAKPNAAGEPESR